MFLFNEIFLENARTLRDHFFFIVNCKNYVIFSFMILLLVCLVLTYSFLLFSSSECNHRSKF